MTAAGPRLRRALSVAALVATVLLLVALPFMTTLFYLGIATRVLILAMFALAFNVVFGMGGMPSLGHAAFFGVGGYAVGLGVTRFDLGFAEIVLLTLALGALLGLLFGVLTLRTDGIYLLLLTLALAQAVWGLAFQQVGLTGGDNGIAGISRDTIPLPVTGGVGFYYFVAAVLIVVAALLWQFARSPVGRAIVGVRESASRMAALGYHVAAYKVVAFAVSGMFSALAGALFVYENRFVGPENLDWPTSAAVMVYAILGGAASFFGPALGALVLIALETWTSGFTTRWLTVLGAIYIVTILFLPDGLLGLGGRMLGLRRRPAPKVDDLETAADEEERALASDGGGP